MTSDKVLRLIEDRIKHKVQDTIHEDEKKAAIQKLEDEKKAALRMIQDAKLQEQLEEQQKRDGLRDRMEEEKRKTDDTKKHLEDDIAREEQQRLLELQAAQQKRQEDNLKKEKLHKQKTEQEAIKQTEKSLIANRDGKARPKVQMSLGLGMKKKK